MASNNVRATLILRNDLATNWETRNPVLAQGELGAEIDTGLLKLGDGTTNFNNLNYINLGKPGDGVLITTTNNQFTVAGYGTSYWRYDANNDAEVEVQETDLTKWPSTVELQVKNGVARWVQPKISYDPFTGTISGALITLDRNPIANNEATTKSYVDTTIANRIADVNHLKREIVTTLPTTNLDVNTIYMMLDTSATGADRYKEYMVINNALVQIGDTSVDLSNYVQKPTVTQAGNLVSLAADGSLVDSGVAASSVGQLPVATTTVLGGVYSSTADNYVSVNTLGFMTVNNITRTNSVATDALYVPAGSELVLNGGTA